MPRADDVPSFDCEFAQRALHRNPLGVKGAGEAGAVGSPPAVINAVVDALHARAGRQAHRHAGDAREGLASAEREALILPCMAGCAGRRAGLRFSRVDVAQPRWSR